MPDADTIDLRTEFAAPASETTAGTGSDSINLKQEFSAPSEDSGDLKQQFAPPKKEADVQEDALHPFATESGRQKWNDSTPWQRVKILLSHPWEKYAASVDQAFQGKEIPQVTAPTGEGIGNRAQQLGAALDNTATGFASGLLTRGGIATALNPESAIYSAPRFIVSGLHNLKEAMHDPTFQGRVQKIIAGELMVGGGIHGGIKGTSDMVGKASVAAGKLRAEADQAATPGQQTALDHAADAVENVTKEAPENPLQGGIPTAQADEQALKPLPPGWVDTGEPPPGTIGQRRIIIPGQPGGEARFEGSSEPKPTEMSPEEARAAGYDVDLRSEFEHPQNPAETPPEPLSESQASDYHRYLAIQSRIGELTRSGDLESPEFMQLWKENEEIKNRNPVTPGMPPSAPVDLSEQGLQKAAESQPEVGLSPAQPEEEPQQTSEEKPPNYGIAARVSEARAAAGNIEPIEPGEGLSSEESVQHGRDLLESGRDPQQAIDDFNKTGKTSAEDIALARAYGEQLYKTAQDAAEKFGPDSEEYAAAQKADSDWTKAIKPMQTEWHRQGQAMQGETEIDTGTFHGLRRAYMDQTGRDFSDKQAGEAQDMASKVRQARTESDAAQQKLFDFMATMPRSFKDTGVQQVWELAKQYLASGETSFDEIRHKIAADMGIPVDEVTQKLAQTKGMKQITNDMWAAMSKRRQLESAARNWLDNQKMPGWQRFATKLPRAFFRIATAGHGTVWLVTHTSPEIFKPQDWGELWPNYFKAFKLMGLHDGGAYHERMMQELERNPNFITARRAGLENDPSRRVDDYQKAWMGGWFNKLGLSGNRGFDGLKLLRQDLFDKAWNEMPDSMRTRDMSKMLADAINHSTGASSIRFPEWASWTFFAPRLEASRWQWLISDPAKAAKILTPSYWKDATPAEREFAISQVKEKATIAGVYLSLLAANQALLSTTDSKERINFTDPTHSDFLAFKGGGYKFGVGTPFLGIVRLLASLVNSARGAPANYQKRESTPAQIETEVGDYARSKLSPFGGLAADVITHADYEGRPLPFSNKKVPPSLHKQGIYTKYSYPEYLSQKLTPIPVSDAIQEVWKHQGMDETTMHHWMGAIMSGALSGASGARMSPDTNPQGK